MGEMIKGRTVKGIIFSLLIVVTALFTSCPGVFDLDNQQFNDKTENLPPGMGSFSLSLSSARTIQPAAPALGDFAVYELVFTATSGGVNSTVDRTNATLSTEQIILAQGTYSLTVSAYKDTSKTQLAARGTLSSIVISSGQNTPGKVTLNALIGEPGAQGTFSWRITFNTAPVNLTSAEMTIKNSIGVTQGSSVTLAAGLNEGSRENLPSGVYTVIFNVTGDGDRSFVWSELLHIYSTLESECVITFNSSYFNNTHHNVTLAYNNGQGNGTQSVMHGDTLAAPSPPLQAKTSDAYLYAGATASPGWVFDKWYSDQQCTIEWDFTNTRIHGNTTIYAGWTGPVNVSAMAGNNDFEKAVAYVNANPATGYALYAAADLTVAPQTLNAWSGLTLTGTGGARTITISSGSPVFAVADSATLRLGENIVLNGNVSVSSTSGFYMQDNSTIAGTLSLASDGSSNSSVNLSSWTGGVGSFNLTAPSSTIAGVVEAWIGRPVVLNDLTRLGYLNDKLSNLVGTGVNQPVNKEDLYKINSGGVFDYIYNGTPDIAFEPINASGNVVAETAAVAYRVIRNDLASFTGELTIPPYYKAKPVTEIGDFAFYTKGITSVNIPASVKVVGEFAFSDCANLTAVNFAAGSQLETIGFSAFRSCPFASITIPSSVTTIGESAFAGSSLINVSIPASVTSIGAQAFVQINTLESITVASNNPNYASEDGVLYNKSKKEILAYPLGTLTSGTLTIPSGVEKIGEGVFSGALLSDVIMPSVTTIGSGAFVSSGIITLYMPGVTGIEGSAFFNSESMTSITIAANCNIVTLNQGTRFSAFRSYYLAPDGGNSHAGTYLWNGTEWTGPEISYPTDGINITLQDIIDHAPSLTQGLVLNLLEGVGKKNSQTFNIDDATEFNSIEWIVNGVTKTGTGTYNENFTLTAWDYGISTGHTLMIRVVKDGVTYSTTIMFGVEL